MAKQLLSVGIFVLGMLVSGVPCVIFYTLKIDGIIDDHKQEVAAKNEAIALCQSQVEQFKVELTAKDGELEPLKKRLAEATAKPDSLTSTTVALAKEISELLKKPWDTLTPKEKELIWFHEIRRVAKKPELTEDECRQAYKAFSFSIRLQLEASLQKSTSLRQAVAFHRDLQDDSIARALINAALSQEKTVESYMQILSKDQQTRILELTRKDQRTMEDNEAWVTFSSRRPHEQMRIIADIINNDVLRAAPSLFPTQSGGFGSNSQYSVIEYKGVSISDDSIAKSIGIDFVELRKLLFSSPFEKYP